MRIVMGMVVGLGITRILMGLAGLIQHPARARLSLTSGGCGARLADIGGIAYAADIAQMRHETLEPRNFRS